MAIYAIGDVQGCYEPLMRLIDKIKFDTSQDVLWFVGDLINRGPQSLEVLRFVKGLGSNAVTVLGNHDLHLLATVLASRKIKPQDTFQDIINAPDQNELLHWLGHRPLVHYDDTINYLMVHAGIPPIWGKEKALALAKEVEQVLRSEDRIRYFQAMYGNKPVAWQDQLEGMERLRVITNYFTRMRFCRADGTLDLESKASPTTAPKGFAPWFSYDNPSLAGTNIVFGHWAALEGKCPVDHIHALDTGCVWGSQLTAFRLSDKKLFCCNCSEY